VTEATKQRKNPNHAKRNKKTGSETLENVAEEVIPEMAVVAVEFEPITDETELGEPTEAEIAELAADAVSEVAEEFVSEPAEIAEPVSEPSEPVAEAVPTEDPAPVEEPVANSQQAILSAIDARVDDGDWRATRGWLGSGSTSAPTSPRPPTSPPSTPTS